MSKAAKTHQIGCVRYRKERAFVLWAGAMDSARGAPRHPFMGVPIACRFPASGAVLWIHFRVREWALAESCIVVRAI